MFFIIIIIYLSDVITVKYRQSSLRAPRNTVASLFLLFLSFELIFTSTEPKSVALVKR